MVYSDIQIRRAVSQGHIVIHPMIEDNIRGSSVDVTLGEYFYTTEGANTRDFYNPFDAEDVNR